MRILLAWGLALCSWSAQSFPLEPYPYSIGQYELILKDLDGSQISVVVPLPLINSSLRDGLIKAGQDSKDVPFTVGSTQFNFGGANNFTLSMYLQIDGRVNAIGENFTCASPIEFAIPRTTDLEISSQVLVVQPNCTFSGFLAQQGGLSLLLTPLFGMGLTYALDRNLFDPKDAKGNSFVELMKSDPEIAQLLKEASLQASYCSTTRFPQAFCVNLAWRRDGLNDHFTALYDASPDPAGPINLSSSELQARAQAFANAAPRKPSTRIPGYKFPAKRFPGDPLDPATYDDGDAMIFAGLICLVGDQEGCEAVAKSQGSDGRFWRSPDRVNSSEENPFSGDQLNGLIAYLIATKNKKALGDFLSYVRSNRAGIPKESPLDYGYKSCANDRHDTCLISGPAWHWIGVIAKSLGLEQEIPADMQDVGQKFGYSDGQLRWEAAFAPRGYRMHLVSLHLLFARVFDMNTVGHHSAAAAVLVAREPGNPFFRWLLLGNDISVLKAVEQKCSVDPAQRVFSEWSWERKEADQAWKDSMGWDCSFMYRLLASDWGAKPWRHKNVQAVGRPAKAR